MADAMNPLESNSKDGVVWNPGGMISFPCLLLIMILDRHTRNEESCSIV